MSLAAIRWAMEQRAGSATAKAVLLVLAEAADASGRTHLAQRTIAAAAELGERAVRDALAALETAGLLEREHRYRKGKSGGRTTDACRLTLAAPDAGKIPAPDAGKGGYRHETPVTGGDLPAPDAGLVPTVLEPKRILPPVSPVGGPDLGTPKTKGRGARFCPADFQPTLPHHRLAQDRHVDLDAELAVFRDHEFPRCYTDWDRTFTNWLRRAKPGRTPQNGNGNRIHLRPHELPPEPERAPQKTRMQVEHEQRLKHRAANGA